MRAGILGPILRWEMTTVVRRRRYFWLRVAYSAVLALVLWTTYSTVFWRYDFDGTVQIERFAVFASAFFGSFSFTQLCAVLVLTPAYVGTAIAVEKERKTFEYILLTDLTDREIVLGKWAARILNVLMLVLAGIPIVSFAGLCGGIDFGQLLVLAVLTINTVLATSALAILVSVYSPSVRQALVNAYGVLFLLLISPLLYMAGVELVLYAASELGFGSFGQTWRALLEWPGRILQLGNPFVAYQAIVFNFSGRTNVMEAIGLMTLIHGSLTAVALGLAVWRVRRFYQRQLAGARPKVFTALRNRRLRKVPPVSERPMLWKELYFDRPQRSGCTVTLLAIVILSLLLLWCFWYISVSMTRAEDLNMLLRTLGTAIVGLVYLVVAVRAAGSIGMERDHDCWVSLLSTPLTGQEIVTAKLAGALKPLFGFMVLAVPVYSLAVCFDALALLAIPATLIAIAVYGVFLAALGVYHSLRRRTTGGAIGATIATASVFFGLGHALGGFLFAMLVFAVRAPGFNDDFLVGIYVTSIPWVIVACAPFRWDDLSGFDRADEMAMIGSGIFFVFAFAAAAALLYWSCVAQFTRWTGRSDQDDISRDAPSLVVTGSSDARGD